ncbi:HD family phosphohydrolase [Falsibacillus albus]|uniref:HD family phosphohydrolase n=1 Tax=Falsibacillus albus TaxID=2478915 RepID=A0A3L7KC68_9BACI|nr:HD family phosphohydrolase [Falsibacillus albus]RLQ98182.1 HD family phosphohydrolase [Falsibacillus albus]
MQEIIGKIRNILSLKLFTSLIFIALALLIYGVLYSNVKPETYDIELFSVAQKNIYSPKTVIDEQKTNMERDKAADDVGNVYEFKKEVGQNRIALISSIFDFIDDVKQDAQKSMKSPDPSDEAGQSSEMSLQDQLQSLKSKLTKNATEDITKYIPDSVFLALLQANTQDLSRVKSVVINQIGSVMGQKIKEEDVQSLRQVLEQRIKSLSFSEEIKNAAIELGKYAIVPNDLYSPDLTEERKQQARDSIEPEKIFQGELLAEKNQTIDKEVYRKLKLLGLLKSNPTIKPLVGLAIFVFVMIGTLYIHFFHLNIPEERKQNFLILISLILLSSLLIMKIIDLMEELDIEDLAYIFPAAMGPMLIRILLNERIAMIVAILIAACGSIIFHGSVDGTVDVEIALYILFSGLSGILFLSNQKHRLNILQAGIFVSFVNVLLLFFLVLMGDGQFSRMEYIYYILFAFASGISSAVLTIGFLPFFEAGFGILSTMKLIELSNPNHPLLKKILTEAPGTYHHSVMVANLADAACEAIGCNGLLARVGCYYHDIGKTRRPFFFIENQMNMDNPHDRLSPDASKDIIIAHATDGGNMLRKYKIPKEIIDIAEQHHGTTLLKFFYHKAKESKGKVEESDFRYPGPKPQTKEAAVISIADSVEAAVRSKTHPTPEEIKKVVHSIVQDRLQDGQFNECDITLKELEVVKRTLCETLNGIFHSRIEYPDMKRQKVKEA